MRTVILSVLILGLASSAAFAQFPGGGPGSRTYPRLNVINNCDGAVAVTLDGREWTTLEPAQSFTVQYIALKSVDVTVGATLVGTSISDTETVTLFAGKIITASITYPASTSLTISFSMRNGSKSHVARE